MTANDYKYDPEWVSRHFDDCGEKEWERLVQTPVDEVSLHLHAELLREHLQAGMNVLEVGAGAGRFTQILAGLDCRITVTDLSEGQLKLNRKKAEELEFAAAIDGWHRLDMCDMTCFPDESFDAVISYGGPISYVFDRADRALSECGRVLKDDGVFLCSVMSLWGSIHRYLPGVMDVAPEQNKVIVATGDLTPETEAGNKHHCHMYRSPELRSLLERHGLTIIGMSASNILSVNWQTELAEIRKIPEKWSELLRMEKEACRQPGCWDAGTHLIAVCRK